MEVTISAVIHVAKQSTTPYDNQNIWIYETTTNDYKIRWGLFNGFFAEAKLVSYDKYDSYYPTAENVWMEPSCATNAGNCGNEQTSNRAWNGSIEENVYMQTFNISGPIGTSVTLYARTKVDGYGNVSFDNSCTGC